MSISEEPLDAKIHLIKVSDRLDHTQSDKLEDILQSLIANGKIRLIVDLSATSFINSSGLRCLVSGWRNARDLGGNLVLCGLDNRISNIVLTVGFDRIFKIHESVDEAKKYLADR
jgi:anti-sigma B factor antagonist